MPETRFGHIALMGLPNAGKSTFLNTLIQEKVSIVSDKAQTTRGMNLGIYTKGHIQIGFLDLPGVHKPKHEMNRRMMKLVRQGLEDSDAVFHLVDATSKKHHGDGYISQMIREKELPYFLLANKIDLINKQKLIGHLAELQERFQPDHIVPISAKEGDNLDHLVELVTPFLPEGVFRFELDDYTNQSVRSMVRELIRERVLFFTRDEIPHASTVELETFELDPEEDRYYIDAVIYVEKPGQRKILIGKNGSMLKKIKNGLNNNLSKLLYKSVSCDLFIKVKTDWRNREAFLDQIEL